MSMRNAAAALALLLSAQQGYAIDPPTLAPPAPPKPNILRLLAPADAIDPAALEAFEKQSGFEVAYDAYVGAPAIAERWREGPYDLAILPGPAVAQYIAANALQKLNFAALPAAKNVSAALAAKFAVYDPSGDYALPADWGASGIVFDVDKVSKRFGAPPSTWTMLFAPGAAAKLRDCGIALPDSRDDLFIAVWRSLGIDPSKPRDIDVRAGAETIIRMRAVSKAFRTPNISRLLASGADCIGIGDQGVAQFASRASAQAGKPVVVNFVMPREGGALSIDAYAIPRAAAQADQAYALMAFLMRPEIAAQNARLSGLSSAMGGARDVAIKPLWPSGAFEPKIEAMLAKEWERVRSLDKPVKAAAKPKPGAKPTPPPLKKKKTAKP